MDTAIPTTPTMLRACQEEGIAPICPGTCRAPYQVFYNYRWYVRGKDGRYRRRLSRHDTGPAYLHQQVWIDARYSLFDGPARIPAGHEIHHRDFNRLNNHSSNLVALLQKDHRALHYAAQSEAEQRVSRARQPCTSCQMRRAGLEKMSVAQANGNGLTEF